MSRFPQARCPLDKRDADESVHVLFPPHVGMDEYADFVIVSLQQTDPQNAALQKAIEERITTPFSLRET
jgi:hypothetical protein